MGDERASVGDGQWDDGAALSLSPRVVFGVIGVRRADAHDLLDGKNLYRAARECLGGDGRRRESHV